MRKSLGQIGEKPLLQRLRKYLGSSPRLIRTFSEDCAVLDSDGDEYQLYTADVLVENVHFRLDYFPGFYIGRKALKINISDISAMGGAPAFYMISLGAPKNTPLTLIDEIYEGMRSVEREVDVMMIGGNVSSSDSLFVDIFMTGTVPKDEALFRNGAKNGDSIFVTGRLGASAEGLLLLQRGFRLLGGDAAGVILPEGELDSRYAREAILAHYDPPLSSQFARQLAQTGKIHCMIDISDGLVSDLEEICRESGVGAEIQLRNVPIAPAAQHWELRRKLDPLQLALCGGEDYHLLFTASQEHKNELMEQARRWNASVFEIGRILDASEGVYGMQDDARVTLPRGFQHFQS